MTFDQYLDTWLNYVLNFNIASGDFYTNFLLDNHGSVTNVRVWNKISLEKAEVDRVSATLQWTIVSSLSRTAYETKLQLTF